MDATEVVLEKNSISIRNKDISINFIFDDLSFLPHTCRGLTFLPISCEIQFSVQVDKEQEIITKPSNRSQDLQETLQKQIQEFQENCFCSMCQAKILSNHTKFTHVFPLPSEEWSSMMDVWFCHQHDDQSACPESISMDPRSHDCHVGDTFFLLDCCHVSPSVTEREGDVFCTKCRAVLGEVVKKSTKNGIMSSTAIYKIYRHAVIFCNPGELDNSKEQRKRYFDIEEFCARLILEQSVMYTSFKFLVSSRRRDKVIHILIWLLDTDATIYQASAKECRNYRMKCQHAVKVLFKVFGLEQSTDWKTDSTYMEWKGDNSVHHLTLPYCLALELTSTLIQSSQSLPKSQRCFEQFMAGHLKYSNEKT